MSKKRIMLAACVLALSVTCVLFGLTGCGNKLPTPSDFVFEADMTAGTNSFSFKTVEGGETYQVAVQKIINDATGEELVPSNQAAKITPPGSDESFYIWSELTGSKTGIKDKDGSGKIDGKVTFREYSSSAETVGGTIRINELPLGKYYVTCVAEATAEKEQSDPAWSTFVVGGKLAEPVFSYTVANGKMTITVDNSYLTNALGYTGLPASIDFTVNDGSGDKTASISNWAYTNTVNGPNKAFTFTHNTVTLDVAGASSYQVSAVAKGDGDAIKDSDTVKLAPALAASAVPAEWFDENATTFEMTAKTTDGMTIGMTVDKDHGKWAVEGYVSSGGGWGPNAAPVVKTYYGGAWGTFDETDGAYAFAYEGGKDFATVNSFAIAEYDDEGSVKKATANVSVTHTSWDGYPATADLSYTKSSGGWGPPM